MADYSWQEVENGGLAAAPSVIGSSFQAAKGFACGLYKDYQGYFGNIAPQGPLEGLKRGVWDKLCGPGALPPVPTEPPPFDGNSCSCVVYRATLRVTRPDGTGFDSNSEFTGPFFGLSSRTTSPDTKATDIIQGRCVDGRFVGSVTGPGDGGTATENSVSLKSITRISPSSDCPQIPPPPAPTPPPPDRQRENAPITIAPNVTINAPVTLVGPSVNVSLNPSIEVAVGPLNFNFSLGGVKVDVNPTFSPTVIVPIVNLPGLPPDQPPRPNPLPPDGGDCPDPCEPVDYRRIEDAISAERKFYARAKTRLNQGQLGGGVGGSLGLPPRTRFVRVTVTQDPNSVKEQFGAGGPDVLYAGWCSWGVGSPGDRTPISYRVSTFAVPPGANLFTWTIYTGGFAEIDAFVEEDLAECQTDNCTPPVG